MVFADALMLTTLTRRSFTMSWYEPAQTQRRYPEEERAGGGDGMGWSPQYTPLGVFGTTEGSRMARATACRMIRSIAESCGNQEQSGSDAV